MIARFRRYFIIATIFLGGCATLNQSECLNANWQMIGLEDGTKGQALSYIGKHRKACAEFNISPDLDQYQRGHTQGLQQYCTYDRGLQRGVRGQGFKNVCPPELEGGFRLGHQRGREIFRLNVEIKQTNNSIKESHSLLDDLEDDVIEMKELIISRDTRKAEKALLLIELLEAHNEIGSLEADVEFFEQQKAEIIYERNLLKQRYQAGPG
jgi:hypothetical protein